ncbi:MAG: alpha-L-glutamate ligase-like protein [Gammaproteobacteria bacterium]|jgi:alpha-L-glutamate ligase-like protein
MLNRIRKLRKAGVVGINARNHNYVMPNNPRKMYKYVDNKVLTKQLAIKANIAVPKLYGLISTIHDSNSITKIIGDKKDFVIKPAHGSGGKGILVIVNRRKDLFIKPNGTAIGPELLKHHVENILGGVYSLGGQPDQAIIEYRVKFDPVFDSISYQGVPDIRMLIYKGIPTMAMLRLPTQQSDGKANLHQGAVGVGIQLMTGITTHAVCKDRRISEHPDYGSTLSDVQIPGWQNLLLLSARCYELAPLGYLGVDIVLDAELGPLMLELNARPGLAIQIANGAGLKPRFDMIDKIGTLPSSFEDRLSICQSISEH